MFLSEEILVAESRARFFFSTSEGLLCGTHRDELVSAQSTGPRGVLAGGVSGNDFTLAVWEAQQRGGVVWIFLSGLTSRKS